MAQRRMFSKKITDTDMFLDMPLSTQALYFHLNMHADDDGFLGNAKTILRMTGASGDDFKLLVAKKFILTFADGITVIKDWRIHNYIRKDTYNQTTYVAEKGQLSLNSNGSYAFRGRPVDEPSTQVRLGKVRLGKVSKPYSRAPEKNESKNGVKIPYQEIIDYLNQKTGKKFRNTATNQKKIKPRFEEGFTLNDFKKVIDNQVSSWKGTEWERFLRPDTLFRASKFEGYLNNAPKNGGESKSYDGIEF